MTDKTKVKKKKVASTQETLPPAKPAVKKSKEKATVIPDSPIAVALQEALVSKQLAAAQQSNAGGDDEYEDEGELPVVLPTPKVVGREIEAELVPSTVPTTATKSQVVASDDGIDEVVQELPNGAKNLLIMAKPWCFKCTHLVSTDERRAEDLKTYTECHYMNGNKACPAATTRLVRGLPVEETAQALYQATRNADMEADLALRKKISKFDPVMQGLVNTRYMELLRAG